MHVLVILTDPTNYAEALREVSAAKGSSGTSWISGDICILTFSTIYRKSDEIKGKPVQ